MAMKLKRQSRQLTGVFCGQNAKHEAIIIQVDKDEEYRRARMFRRLILNSKRGRNILTSANNTQSLNSQQNTRVSDEATNIVGTQTPTATRTTTTLND
ncbi:hypothetical protein L1887_11654 [Cichorium endivia]|nr:hypothetical protein L1887_11654 [Cichorium endivia]